MPQPTFIRSRLGRVRESRFVTLDKWGTSNVTEVHVTLEYFRGTPQDRFADREERGGIGDKGRRKRTLHHRIPPEIGSEVGVPKRHWPATVN